MATPTVKLKAEYKDKVVGFNGRSLPLGVRKDLDILADIAKKSGDKSLLDLFEETASDAAAKADKTAKTVKSIRKVTGADDSTKE